MPTAEQSNVASQIRQQGRKVTDLAKVAKDVARRRAQAIRVAHITDIHLEERYAVVR